MKLDLSQRFVAELSRRGLTAEEADELGELLEALRTGPLPAYYREHRLRKPGRWQGYSECHIADDWLLVFRRDPSRVLLVATGTHRELFGKP